MNANTVMWLTTDWGAWTVKILIKLSITYAVREKPYKYKPEDQFATVILLLLFTVTLTKINK
jgi:hypothetical protein